MISRPFLALFLTFALATGCNRPQPSAEPPEPTPTVATEPANSPAAEPEPTPPAPLPPETQAIVASAGPDGLFEPPRGDMRIVVFSDLNGIYGSTTYDPEVEKAVKLLPFWQPDLVLCSGDMVAGQSPTLTPEQIQAMWAGFDRTIAAPLREANLPYGFTIGNHDASGARGISGGFLFQQERTLAAEYWQDPAHDPGIEIRDRADFPFYYSFEQGGIFFLVWDGSSSSIPPEKLAWVEETLASPEAQNAKMRVLIGHLPLYAVAVGRNEPGEVMRNADDLRAMLERYNVHTYISGHHHAYYPAHRGDLQLLHMGIIGSGPRPLIDSKLPARKALTVLDVNFDEPDLTTYTTYDMRSLQLIEMGTLPRFLAGHNGVVLRRDVEQLTPEEQAFCINRLGPERCEP